MPLKFDLEGALAEPASGLKFDIESALSPSVGRTPPQDQPLESDLAGIDRIAPVMAGAILDEGDEFGVRRNR